MHAFMNVKMAEKTLQFVQQKCKTMLVGKNSDSVINNELLVDTWAVSYSDTGDEDIIESYEGQAQNGSLV